MRILDTAEALARELAPLRAAGRRIGFVPTMGYLHEGHLALCDAARARAELVVLSIFVNPLQFGPSEDFERYPRDLERDAELARRRGVEWLYAPGVDDMYPAGPVATRVSAPALAARLCGAHRPGHFEGVLTVVAKLFHRVQPHVAVFGQKDFQQAALIRRMVADLDFPVEIVIAPIVRERDGLALSSRNVYLSPEERRAALALSRGLAAADQAWRRGVTRAGHLLAAVLSELEAEPLVEPQYVELVDPDSLEPLAEGRAGAVLAVAAHVGRTRLIDNRILGAEP